MVYNFQLDYILVSCPIVVSELLKQITLWFGQLGYWGVFLACLGIFPAEIVIAMFGALKPENLLQISVVAALGETAGAILTYLVGFYFRNKDILKFLNGKGKFLQISEKSYKNGYKSVRRGGAFYLFISRFVPWLRVVTALVAGYMKFNILILSGAVFAGTFAYAYAFAYIGTKIGFNWAEIKNVIDTFNNISFLLIVLGVGIYFYINRKIFFGKGK